MIKKIAFATVLSILAIGIAAALKTPEKVVSFSQVGYITDRDPSRINDALYLVYDAPGAPALDAKLTFDGKSVCRSGDGQVACIALSATIGRAYGGKRVFVEGIARESDVLVRNVAPDLEASRRFGFIRSIEKNGNNYLVTIDEVEFLSGDAARRAAALDTRCEEDNAEECVPSLNNDFYIRNASTSTEAYNLLPDAQVSIFENPGSPILVEATAEKLHREFRSTDSFMSSYPWMYILDGKSIRKLEEQYLP